MKSILVYVIDNERLPKMKPPKLSVREKVLYDALVEVIEKKLPMNSESMYEVGGRNAMYEYIEFVNNLDYLRIKSKYLNYDDMSQPDST